MIRARTRAIPERPTLGDGLMAMGALSLVVAGVAFLWRRPDPLPPPPPVTDLPVNLIIFNPDMLDFFMRNKRFVHDNDSFTIVSGNFDGVLDTSFITSTAMIIAEAFPGIDIFAATAGRDKIRQCADQLDPDLIRGIVWIWEPNTPDFPDEAFSVGDGETVMAVTRTLFQEARGYCAARRLPFLAKPSGRSLPDGSALGLLDYGVMTELTDGLMVQTQGSCKDGRFIEAADFLVNEYVARGIDALSKLYLQVTVSEGDQTNGVSPEHALTCAMYGWSLQPVVDRMTIWWVPDERARFLEFLLLREEEFAMLPVE